MSNKNKTDLEPFTGRNVNVFLTNIVNSNLSFPRTKML